MNEPKSTISTTSPSTTSEIEGLKARIVKVTSWNVLAFPGIIIPGPTSMTSTTAIINP